MKALMAPINPHSFTFDPRFTFKKNTSDGFELEFEDGLLYFQYFEKHWLDHYNFRTVQAFSRYIFGLGELLHKANFQIQNTSVEYGIYIPAFATKKGHIQMFFEYDVYVFSFTIKTELSQMKANHAVYLDWFKDFVHNLLDSSKTVK